ncbi:hypothetical protein PROH_12370 [Prochlorothrix hollandica PCC 9006 = CALU 1027]|uniref:Uncharacterized protein n=1 Tax=Prochlorothrix hollandica PCC 9006 = CALU 1027 TaxID=317619 RepID=A0A0M2Q0F6_PROHO|nr:hypothetical protein PROH_12370 [Prochlorothrix hollandica PCC 9006 = CALU 1027]
MPPGPTPPASGYSAPSAQRPNSPGLPEIVATAPDCLPTPWPWPGPAPEPPRPAAAPAPFPPAPRRSTRQKSPAAPSPPPAPPQQSPIPSALPALSRLFWKNFPLLCPISP